MMINKKINLQNGFILSKIDDSKRSNVFINLDFYRSLIDWLTSYYKYVFRLWFCVCWLVVITLWPRCKKICCVHCIQGVQRVSKTNLLCQHFVLPSFVSVRTGNTTNHCCQWQPHPAQCKHNDNRIITKHTLSVLFPNIKHSNNWYLIFIRDWHFLLFRAASQIELRKRSKRRTYWVAFPHFCQLTKTQQS